MANQGRHDPDVVVAPGRRSVCLNKCRFSNNVAQAPLPGHRRCNRPPLVFVCNGIFGENVNELSYGE